MLTVLHAYIIAIQAPGGERGSKGPKGDFGDELEGPPGFPGKLTLLYHTDAWSITERVKTKQTATGTRVPFCRIVKNF